MNISGRFDIIEMNEHHTVVGLLGSARAERLNSENIKYLKTCYAPHLENYRILDDFPVSINRSSFNNFIEFYNEATHD